MGLEGLEGLRYKIVVIGDSGTGKSTFMNRLLTGKFTSTYKPTLGVDVFPLVLETNYGSVVFDMWDTAGQDRYGGLRSGYALGAHALVGIFNLTSRDTSLSALEAQVKDTYSHLKVPMVLCGNKCDIAGHNPIESKSVPDIWDEYYDISVKSGYNIREPLLYLARRLTGHDDLVFKNPEPLNPSSKPPEL